MSMMACECSCCQNWEQRMKADAEFHATLTKLSSEHSRKVMDLLLEVRQRVAGLATARQQHDLVEWLDAEMEKLNGPGSEKPGAEKEA